MRYAVKVAEMRVVRKVVEARSLKEARWATVQRYVGRDEKVGTLIVSVEPVRGPRKGKARVQKPVG